MHITIKASLPDIEAMSTCKKWVLSHWWSRPPACDCWLFRLYRAAPETTCTARWHDKLCRPRSAWPVPWFYADQRSAWRDGGTPVAPIPLQTRPYAKRHVRSRDLLSCVIISCSYCHLTGGTSRRKRCFGVGISEELRGQFMDKKPA